MITETKVCGHCIHFNPDAEMTKNYSINVIDRLLNLLSSRILDPLKMYNPQDPQIDTSQFDISKLLSDRGMRTCSTQRKDSSACETCVTREYVYDPSK